MAMFENNKKCLVCGKVYTYCGSCAAYRNKPVWMTTFHDDNCRQIFNVVSAYNADVITLKEARNRLGECDLSVKDTVSQKLRKTINEILNNNTVDRTLEAPKVDSVSKDTVGFGYKKSKKNYK